MKMNLEDQNNDYAMKLNSNSTQTKYYEEIFQSDLSQ